VGRLRSGRAGKAGKKKVQGWAKRLDYEKRGRGKLREAKPQTKGDRGYRKGSNQSKEGDREKSRGFRGIPSGGYIILLM